MTAFDPIVGSGQSVIELDPIPALKLRFLELTESDGKEALPLPFGGYASATDCLTILLAGIRERLDEDDNAGVFERGGHIVRVHRQKGRKLRARAPSAGWR